MKIESRRQKERNALRELILSAAEKLFLRDGYEKVSMRKIAVRIGYSPTVIYHYFKNKGELLFFLLEKYHARLLAIMKEINSKGYDPITRLRKGARAYTDFGLSNPSYYRLAFVTPREYAAEDFLVKGQAGTELFQNLVDSVELCIKRRLFRPMDPMLGAQILWSMNHGVTSQLIANPNFPWVERNELIDGTIECGINGLRASKGKG
jgi:AcrR family transcriptional regulator